VVFRTYSVYCQTNRTVISCVLFGN